jgi:serine/threonine protein kinase
MPEEASGRKPSPSELPSTLESPSPVNPRATTVGGGAAIDAGATTGFVPSFRSPVASPGSWPPKVHPDVGKQIDDFEILAVLGAGSFARVYLAKQLSLGRQVALKVSANRGCEARTLASLEHDYIVHVFSETVDQGRDLRLLCMQYVPGTNLETVLRALSLRPTAERSGRAILEAIDALGQHPAVFEASALREREFLAGCDFIEAVCWIGARLAEALAYAHTNGILHRDIKPANILLNAYGRPFLADFNIASDPSRAGHGGNAFGGTIGYMAPEHIDAFNPQSGVGRETVDRRSDIYSLGVVLLEFLAGRHPFGHVAGDHVSVEKLQALAASRRSGPPDLPGGCPDDPDVLLRILRRCLHPDPDCRYQNASELARALDGCRELHHIQSHLPPLGWLKGFLTCRPLTALIVLIFLPHLLGSMVNISYNRLQIIDPLLGPEQQSAFWTVLTFYNLIVYPIGLWICFRLVFPVFAGMRELDQAGIVADDRLAGIRRQLLVLPLWVVGLSFMGWFPGGIIFPLGIDWVSGGIPAAARAEIYTHFLISFTMSGLIALTYSFFGVALMVLRVLYPRLWIDAKDFHRLARTELTQRRLPLFLFQVLAGTIPLAGAMLLIFVGQHVLDDLAYRFLVAGLILLGGCGFWLASFAYALLTETYGRFVGGRGAGLGVG